MLWSPATARVVFRDDVEIQYHPTIIHYYEEYTLKEIYQITGSNLNTVKSRLYAGLKKLKEIVKEDVQ